VTYKGYVISGRSPHCVVYHPDYAEPVYRAGDFKEAKRFINAYRDGTVWAVQAFSQRASCGAAP